MTHTEQRIFLIKELLAELPQYKDMEISKDNKEQKRLLRSLMNIRLPRPVSSEFLKIQDEYLSKEVEEKPKLRLHSIFLAAMYFILSDRLYRDGSQKRIADRWLTATGLVWNLRRRIN